VFPIDDSEVLSQFVVWQLALDLQATQITAFL
jgi:hypothetical protein